MLKRRVVLFGFIAALVISFSFDLQAQISKGQQVLLSRGLQIQGLSQDDCYVHSNTYANLNYSSIQWDNSPGQHGSRNEWMGPPPGFLWSRWAVDQTQMPPMIPPNGTDEGPYMPQLISLQLADEWNLNDGPTRTNLINWFLSVQSNYPSVMLYHNSYGSQVGDSQLFDFYSKAHPDMLCFDTYPWQSIYDTSYPNSTGPALPGPPTGWYGDLRRYREHARGAGVPLAIYRQMFHSVQDYDQHVFRDPSPSELRLNTFAGLAFNAKFISDFIYNTGAGSLFDKTFNGSGDTQISTNNHLYAEMQDVNARARNFGKALVNLTAITTEGIPGFTTSIMFIRGKDSNGNTTTVPVGFLADQDTPGANYTDWVYQRNDPYLTNNWTVTNLGNKNNGQPGDVIISWFKPLDEALDGTTYSNEVYLMAVNGLTDPTGEASNCLQEITLNFTDGFSAINMLNPLTGAVQTQALPLVNGYRQLVLDLNGGDAALFKFSDGAPFVGFSAPILVTQPNSVTNIAGTQATFSVRAGGAAPLAFQWRLNGTNIPGATQFTYSRTNVQIADSGPYTLVITNSLGSVTSSVASITVYVAPQITNQPASQTLTAGTTATFTVGASGIPAPNYQWQYNGTNIFGATGSSYARTNLQSLDAGNYSVIVSNVVASTVSSNAVLVVNGPPSITRQPLSKATLAGSNVTFSVTAVGSGALTYQWQHDGSAVSGATNSALALTNVQSTDLGNYLVLVSNAYGSTLSSAAALVFASPPTIQTQPQSQSANVGAVVFFTVTASGGNLSYQWRRYGTNLADGGNISGATNSILSLNGVTGFDATNYSVVITNVAGSVTSAPAVLTLNFAYPMTEQFNYPAGSVLSNQMTPDFVLWTDIGTGTPGPVVTNIAGNLNVTGLAPSSGNSVRFGSTGKSARLSLTGHTFSGGTVYFSFAISVQDLTGSDGVSGGFVCGGNNSTGTQSGQPTVVAPRIYIRTNSTGYSFGISKNSDGVTAWDTGTNGLNQTVFVVASYTFIGSVGSDDIVNLWINPDPSTFGQASPPSPNVTSTVGTDITPSIASFVLFQRPGTPEPAMMTFDELRIATSWAGVTPVAPPTIAVQPSSIAVNPGTTNLLTVGASGSNLTYQWVRNGSVVGNGGDVSGATTSALKLGPTTTNDAGTYQVIVTSPGGLSAVSAPATVTLNAAPTISAQPQNMTVPVGGTASFGVGASGTAPFGYQWRLNGTNLPGASGSAYVITNVQRFNAGPYSALITNIAGSTVSSNGILRVTPITPVHIDSFSLQPGGAVRMTGSGDPGQFIVQSSSNLLDWSDLSTVSSDGNTFLFTDSVTNANRRFYRAKLYP